MANAIDQLLEVCPVAPTMEIERALALLDRLSSVPAQLPATRGNANLAVRIGSELMEALRNPTVFARAQSMASRFLGKGQVSPSDLSELDTAILARILGAEEVLFIPPSEKERRPDLLAFWANDDAISLEVTRGREKRGNLKRIAFANDLHRRIPTSWTVKKIIHISVPIEPADVSDLLRHAQAMPPDAVKENPGHWRVITHKMETNGTGLSISGDFPDPPQWWKPSSAMATVLAAPMMIHPTEMQYGECSSISVPFDRKGYLNPLTRKVKRNQSIRDIPHIVVVDVLELPDAFHAYRDYAIETLAKSPEISAVLLFQHVFSLPHSRWDFALYANPLAANPLPSELLKKLRGDGTQMNCKVNFKGAA